MKEASRLSDFRPAQAAHPWPQLGTRGRKSVGDGDTAASPRKMQTMAASCHKSVHSIAPKSQNKCKRDMLKFLRLLFVSILPRPQKF